MDYFKILLLLLSAGLHLHLSNAKKPPKPWQHNTRRMNGSPDDNQNCICFPDGELPIVQQLLDPNNKGLQRIVIYLYINDATNEVKMYTPSAEKQMLIPDLLYEPTDGLYSVTPENVFTLIHNSPNKIKVYDNRFEALDPDVSHSLPIGLNQGAIEHVLPPITDDIYLNPLNNSNGNEYALDGSVTLPNAQVTALVSEPQHASNAYPENTDANTFFPTEGNTYNPEPTQPYWMSDNTNYPNGQGQAFPEHAQSSTGYAQAFGSSSQVITPESTQPSTGYAQGFPTNSQSTPANIQTATGYPLDFPTISQDIPENTEPLIAYAFPSNSEISPENNQFSIINPQANNYPTNSQGIPENSQSLTGYAQAYPANPQSTPDNVQSSVIYPQAYPTNSQGIPENAQSSIDYAEAFPTNPQNTPDNTQFSIISPQAYPANSQGIPENAQSSTGYAQAFSTNPQSTPDNAQYLTGYAQPVPSISQGIPENIQSLTDYHQSYPSSQGISENIYSLPGYHQPYPSNFQGIPGNTQSLTGHPQAVPSNLDKPQGYWDNSQPLLEKHEAKPLTGDLNQHIVYTFKTSQDQGSHPGSKEIEKPYYIQYVTFNVWFNQQMKRFQNINLPNQIQSIDSQFLRLLVLKTLSDNNIFISDDGIITDSNGALIDVSNLELRPLLIGEKINHRILQNFHQPITLPKHLPYLEGILVQFVSPPRILGIIPLGKTYLLQKSYSTPLLSELIVNRTKMFVESSGNRNPASYLTSSEPYTLIVKASYTVPMKKKADSVDYHTYDGGKDQPIPVNLHSAVLSKSLATAYPSIANEASQAEGTDDKYWSSRPYSTSTQPPFVTNYVQTLPPARRKQPDAKIEHHLEPTIKTRKKNRGLIRKRPGLKDNVDVIAEPFANINGSESGRRSPSLSITDVMKTLLNLLDDLPSRRDLKTSSEKSDSGEDSESEDDREGPNFRIIGGSAATGSGSPVSNKGRSGFTESI